ncbi:MAG: 50S ribosomal protein L13 [Planctomycetota bacterium]
MRRETFFAKSGDLPQEWYHVDADGEIMGRLATRIARVLMGKHRPEYTPHIDTGAFVVVTNARGVRLTGRKAQHKFKLNYSGYPGGLKSRSYAQMLEQHPDRLLEDAVRRMLPKGRLGRQMIKKLKVYSDGEHHHQAQQPKPLPAWL